MLREIFGNKKMPEEVLRRDMIGAEGDIWE